MSYVNCMTCINYMNYVLLLDQASVGTQYQLVQDLQALEEAMDHLPLAPVKAEDQLV